MKLATLKRGGRDGTLIVVDRSLRHAATVPKIARTLQEALDRFEQVEPALRDVYERLNAGGIDTSFGLKPEELAAPLPRAYQWLDGSAYIPHMERVRRARAAELPPNYLEEPLMYQGGGDPMLGPRDPIPLMDEAWGLDFEAEVAAITDDVPCGVSVEDAFSHIKLLVLVNDLSLRNLIPAEARKGFGFLHGKPPSALSPVAVAPIELGLHFRAGKLHLPLVSEYNDRRFGSPDAGVDMTFSFAGLIAHAAKTRPLGAGTIIGSGTVSNRDPQAGFSCIAERRALEALAGTPQTRYMHAGDRIRIEVLDPEGRSIFGAIDQVVR